MTGSKSIVALLFGLVLVVLGAAVEARAADVSSADDTAKFLAGIAPSTKSPLMNLIDDPSVKQHAGLLDTSFGKLETQQLVKVREWAATNLTTSHAMMYYFFSGPDFLYANAFFPNASTYIMSGLEPVGQIPDLTRLQRGTVGQALRNIQVSMSSILNFSYFITKQMREDLNNGPLNGTLPILYVFLARSGKTIHDVTLVYLDENGDEHVGDGIRARSTARGVKITFSGNDKRLKTLYFFSTSVADEPNGQYALLKFCRQFSRGDSFIKSASYLMHRSSFSKVRNLILDQSAQILQDDSGIPLANFETGRWFLHPFGRYTQPLNMFSEHYQPNLTALYQRKPPGAMNFGLGYSSRFEGSNLLLAIRNPGAPDLTISGLRDATRHPDITARGTLKKPGYPMHLPHMRASRADDEKEIY